MDAVKARMATGEEETISDDERRHQEVLAYRLGDGKRPPAQSAGDRDLVGVRRHEGDAAIAAPFPEPDPNAREFKP